jgi:hypothetical protein
MNSQFPRTLVEDDHEVEFFVLTALGQRAGPQTRVQAALGVAHLRLAAQETAARNIAIDKALKLDLAQIGSMHFGCSETGPSSRWRSQADGNSPRDGR